MNNIDVIYKKFIESNCNVCTDTRKNVVNSFFVCLRGENFDANTMAELALEKEANYVLCERVDLRKNPKIIYVEDSLQALTDLARYHRQQMNAQIIAVGGSNGKTTTKELIGEIFSLHDEVHITPGNFNNHIGVPLTLLALKPEHAYGIIELGINHPGEMRMLCEIALPNEGLLTNIGKEHLEGFGDIEGVAKAESELFQYLLETNGKIYVNTDDQWIANMARRFQNCINYGINQMEERGIVLRSLNPNIQFSLDGIEINSSLSGDYNFSNILCAIAVAQQHNISSEHIAKGISNYVPSNNRSQWMNTDKNRVLMDCYNANPTSMKLALENFIKLSEPNLICILGDMLEMGSSSQEEHQSIVNWAANQRDGLSFYFVGPEFGAIKNSATEIGHFFPDSNALKAYFLTNPIENATILLKASRGVKLENILDSL